MIKGIFSLLLFIGLTISCIYFPNQWIAGLDDPKKVTVGPHQTYQWSFQSNLTPSDGIYTLKSTHYFEISQSDTTKQSILENPEIGFSDGQYWIRDYPMSGSWQISSGAEIFSLETSEIAVTTNDSQKSFNTFQVIIAAICAWLLGLILLARFNDLLLL
jgi:hypothetical protein